ncbi:uncharacterized protein MYCFIDRAFT_81400 [Pseudocercospora fijiensis CIRAD86]|uniref:Uncharacterized protein n=1 Tax=Pseudocercospora fijiensis (strain CIRAD86) TaxID=383855 RepID=M3AW37_PSEFD|nr:uncharacterized protein MYCFIDRAFT_81400 [Pseudocercospora fijiensis CIRAD86]EME81333.1 hypothetical protein MYCFIDRAFT_81400 [Pseudocercospora fijiensis CIRAD86]
MVPVPYLLRHRLRYERAGENFATDILVAYRIAAQFRLIAAPHPSHLRSHACECWAFLGTSVIYARRAISGSPTENTARYYSAIVRLELVRTDQSSTCLQPKESVAMLLGKAGTEASCATRVD